MPTNRKRMGPEERRDASRRLLALGARVAPLAVGVALDLADGVVSQPERLAELTSILAHIGEILGAIKRDRADDDDTPDGQE